MTRLTTDTDIDRRGFARITLGALGAAAIDGPAAADTRTVTPGIKLCVHSAATLFR